LRRLGALIRRAPGTKERWNARRCRNVMSATSTVIRLFMATKRTKHTTRRSGAEARLVRRAIAKSDPTKEPPTVGKPVITDPVKSRHRKCGEQRSRDEKA